MSGAIQRVVTVMGRGCGAALALALVLHGAFIRAAPVLKGEWSAAGGGLLLVPSSQNSKGSVLWLPKLTVVPNLVHFGPGTPDPIFTATLVDCAEARSTTYRWTTDDPNLVISEPLSRTTRISPSAMPLWRETAVSVTATIGTNALTSTLHFSYGTESSPPVRGLSLDLDRETIFVRSENGRIRSTWIAATVTYSSGGLPAELSVFFPEGNSVLTHDASFGGHATTEFELHVPPYTRGRHTFFMEGRLPSRRGDDLWVESTLRSENGTQLISDRSFTVCEIGWKALSYQPSPRSRTTLGVGEKVRLNFSPDLSDLTICASNATYASESRCLSVGNREGTGFLLASRGDANMKIPFEIVAPRLIRATDIVGEAFSSQGEAGNFRALIDLVVLPTNVSFVNVCTMEIGLKATDVTGYFAGPPAKGEWLTHVGHGADVWIALSEENESYDRVAMPPLPKEWGAGGKFTWPIPNVWRVCDDFSTTNRFEPSIDYDQRFELDPDGTSRILKYACRAEWCPEKSEFILSRPGEQ